MAKLCPINFAVNVVPLGLQEVFGGLKNKTQFSFIKAENSPYLSNNKN